MSFWRIMQMAARQIAVPGILLGILGALSTHGALADESKPLGDVPLLRVGAGYFDVVKRDNRAGELNAEYMGRKLYKAARPIFGVSVTTDKARYLYAGIAFDFGSNGLYFTPSFAPGYYSEGDGKDLGHHLEIRSQVEFGYEFDDASRLGLALSHRSNATLGDKNPGAESLTVYYSMPIAGLFH